MTRPSAPQAIVGLLVVVYIALFGTLSVRRHQSLRTNALDLGYTDQAVWNTLHGRPFRFSTYLDAAFHLDIPIHEFREPGMLLGYHVEPILAAVSLLYLIYDGPETLLWLQTACIALGAIPVYLLARHRFRVGKEGDAVRSGGSALSTIYALLPIAFVVLYLLNPTLEATNLSDFHAVALAPALLLSAFYFLETDRPCGFVVFAFLATMCKEEVGLIVAMMGLWATLVRRRWVLGLATVAAAGGWSLLCGAVIMPHYSGFTTSAFVVRYRQFGDSPVGIVRNLWQDPGLLLAWLGRPDVARYPRDLWVSSGGLAMLCPACMLMALPPVAINTLSIYAWMRSGGGHYSATIVPFLVISSIYGVDWLSRAAGAWVGKRAGIEKLTAVRAVAVGLAVAGLAVALVYHYQNGIAPPSRRFILEPISEHARRAEPFVEFVNDLPPEVAISASSNLYPHVAHRERVYLFPTISDAEFILIDATGPGSPAGIGEQRLVVRDLFDHARFGVAGSDHGFLLLERALDRYTLSPEFYEAFTAPNPTPQVGVGADFGGLLRLEGLDWRVRPVVRPGQVVELTTYWRALSLLDEEYRLVFYFWDETGRLVRIQPEEHAVHWYPTWLWEPGQVVKVTLPALPVGDLARAGVAVLEPGVEDRDAGGRVVPITAAAGQPLVLRENDTIVELVKP